MQQDPGAAGHGAGGAEPPPAAPPQQPALSAPLPPPLEAVPEPAAAGAANSVPLPPPLEMVPAPAAAAAAAAAATAAPSQVNAEHLAHANELLLSTRQAVGAVAADNAKVKAFREECGTATGAAFAACLALQEVLTAAATGGPAAPPLLLVLRAGADVRIAIGSAHRLVTQFGRPAWCDSLLRHESAEDIRDKFAEATATLNLLEQALWREIDPEGRLHREIRPISGSQRFREASGGGSGAGSSSSRRLSEAGAAAAGGAGSRSGSGSGLERKSGEPARPLTPRRSGRAGSDSAASADGPAVAAAAAAVAPAAKAGGYAASRFTLRESGRHKIQGLIWFPEGGGADAAAAGSGAFRGVAGGAGSGEVGGGEDGGGGGESSPSGCVAWASHRNIKVVALGTSVATLLTGAGDGLQCMCHSAAGGAGEFGGDRRGAGPASTSAAFYGVCIYIGVETIVH
jgi:hypothetical protein